MRSAFRTTLMALAARPRLPAAMATDIIVVSHGQASDPFWSVVKNGVERAAKDTGANVEYRSARDLRHGGDGPADRCGGEPGARRAGGLDARLPTRSAPSIENAVAAGIPVISMNSGGEAAKELGALLHVGQSEFDAGKAAGEKMAELGGTKALCVNHEVGNVSLDERCSGFEEGFGGEVTVLPTTNDPTEIEVEGDGRARLRRRSRHGHRARRVSRRGADRRRGRGRSAAPVRSTLARSISPAGSSSRSPPATRPSRSISSSTCRATSRSSSSPCTPSTA